MRLLIVEDEKQICDMVAKSLYAAGYEVDTCYDGYEALDYILTEDYDLIVLDLNLPGMDGMDILRELRKENGIRISLKETYNKSIHTILTSSLIMIIITGVLGFIFKDPAIGEICHIIAIGVTIAVLLILFVLPSIIVLFDKKIVNNKSKS